MQKYKDYYGQPKQALKTWQAALYIRLSKEDMDKNKSESASISNQREILKEYLKLHPDIEHVDTYVDDGYSGTDFDRPGWTRLMKDIHNKEINCVIVKDLARLGRNYAISGDLIDNQFARLGVRFIALNNGIDTAGDGMNAATRCISIGVTNVINESYAASTSVNIRGTLNTASSLLPSSTQNTSLFETFSPAPSETLFSCLIGPEGGFSDKEISRIKSHQRGKTALINLGNTRLRARTAAIIALGKFV